MKKIDAAARESVKPTPIMSVPDWADQYRRLSASAGAIGGPWRTHRVEVARGPMMAVRERGVQTITCMVATQTLKTELLLNTVGYFTHLDPCPMILTQPKEDAVKKFSKERLGPMARNTPVLTALLGGGRQRGGTDTLFYREFPGGFLALESAGSPTNLAMRATRITLADEIDKYETTKEGDPIKLLEERAATFSNRLHIRCCSPTRDDGRINKSYQDSDQRRPFLDCPRCGYSQTLDFFKHVHWEKDEDVSPVVHYPATAVLKCEKCHEEWTEAERLRLLTTRGAITWKQTAPFTCCGVEQKPLETRNWKFNARAGVSYAYCEHCDKRGVSNRHAGFHASKLFSPFTTIVELATAWLACKDDPEEKQTFMNTQLAIPFQTESLKKINHTDLAQRCMKYPAEVPDGVIVLTAGVDVQDSRIEVEVVGWGLGEESWHITHEVFIGDPARPEVWAQLDEFLQRGFQRQIGVGKDGATITVPMYIRAVCIDSGGHNTEDVYKFCRARLSRNVWAIKGASDRGGQWSPVWPVPKQEYAKVSRTTGYKPIILGVNAAKEAIRQRLLIPIEGPGYCHFPEDYPQGRFEQLTAEDLVVETKGGFALRRWVQKKGRANEALDCRVYAYAALCGLYAHRFNMAKAGALISEFVAGTEGLEQPLPAKPAATPPAGPKRVHRSNWMA